jgi:hypothetical protein
MITPSVGTTTASLTETMIATSVSGHVATNRFMTYERINEAAGSTNEKSQAGASRRAGTARRAAGVSDLPAV